ncbi:MAG: DUF2171 domain-containing protein [Deltaproteobacteria bacterium]|nr:DUF2171 domain-containing protein [Deltaproteobacteria bacterium]MBI3296297.1 DUF2171 domain-containing protein [Deltaproteobacteria bacterium]
MVHAKGAGSMKGEQGKHVGTVDHIDGENYIKLTKDDSPTASHRWIPCNWVEKIEGNSVILNKTEEEFKAQVLNYFPGEFKKTA